MENTLKLKTKKKKKKRDKRYKKSIENCKVLMNTGSGVYSDLQRKRLVSEGDWE